MAGLMDNMKDDTDDMSVRYEELRSKESAGELDDQGREELQQLRARFQGKDE